MKILPVVLGFLLSPDLEWPTQCVWLLTNSACHPWADQFRREIRGSQRSL